MARGDTLLCCLLFTAPITFGLPTCNFIDTNKKILTCAPCAAETCVLNRGFVSDNENAEAITIRGGKITALESDSLKNLTSVKYLDLSENTLEQIDPSVFEDLSTLIYLNISYNKLTELTVDLFVNTPNLLVLDLKENILGDLKLGVFDPLQKLKTLDLSWNNFLGRDLSSVLFEKTKQITYISFAGNDMNNTPDDLLEPINSLETLDLNGCTLDEVPLFATKPNLKTLKELILSSNQLSEINNDTVFTHLGNLEILKLDGNELEYIDDKVFKPLINLKVVELQNNQLTYLSDTLFRNIRFLEYIDLSHNVIAIVKLGTFLGKPLRIINLSFNRFTYLKKNFCADLRKAGANLTEFYFHQNPWQCACLADVLSEVEEFHLVHKTDEPGYKKPVCVTTSDYRCKRDDTLNGIYKDIYDKIKLVGSKRGWTSVTRQFSLE